MNKANTERNRRQKEFIASMFKNIETLRIKLKHRKPKNLKLYDLTDMDVVQRGHSFLGVFVSIKGKSGMLEK